MGALHQGHLELVKQSAAANGCTVCSIYVNPTQFNDKQDLSNYPRDLAGDLEKLEANGCDAVFTPSDDIMYPDEPLITMNFGKLEQTMEGLHRPGHFNGVALVVSKLFNLVQPDQVYFGEKDWQQLVIIRQLVFDLSYPLKVIGVPIKREKDGLAMSSRNQRLSVENREIAGQLFKALSLVKESLQLTRNISLSVESGVKHLKKFPQINLEYLQVVRAFELDPPTMEVGEEPLSICLAASLGEIRLIDNIQVFMENATADGSPK